MEEGKVDGKGLGILLLVIDIAVEPHCLHSHKRSEEEECLEADVVEIGNEIVVRRGAVRKEGAPDCDNCGDKDEEQAGAAKDAGPLDHGLLIGI